MTDDEKHRRCSARYAEVRTAEPWMLNLIFVARPIFAIDDRLPFPAKLRLRGKRDPGFSCFTTKPTQYFFTKEIRAGIAESIVATTFPYSCWPSTKPLFSESDC